MFLRLVLAPNPESAHAAAADGNGVRTRRCDGSFAILEFTKVRLRMASTFAIVNLTRDSFSDGGRFFEPGAALAHARALLAAGADVVDLGAESTQPRAADVDVGEQIDRLQPVVAELVAGGAAVSIDTWRPEVMRELLPLGVGWLNCVRGFRAPGALEVAAAAPPTVRFVVMFQRGDAARAVGAADAPATLMAELEAFFRERIAAFAAVGVPRERLVLDPGMGFFLGRTALPSLVALKHLGELAAFGVERMVSVSRKSVIGEITGREVPARGAGTLAAELWAARHGVEWIRTHDVAAFRDGRAVERAIETAP
ncbi:MAG: dihydropteroate synthase [Planctomycetes bacterium]|nr:dihydropteroate synthase [Planctomycetota bacterium]